MLSKAATLLLLTAEPWTGERHSSESGSEKQGNLALSPTSKTNRWIHLIETCYNGEMSKIDSIDVSHINLTPSVFPTGEDMQVWNTLSPEEQRAVIARKVEEGLNSPPASKATKAEIMAEVLAEMKHEI